MTEEATQPQSPVTASSDIVDFALSPLETPQISQKILNEEKSKEFVEKWLKYLEESKKKTVKYVIGCMSPPDEEGKRERMSVFQEQDGYITLVYIRKDGVDGVAHPPLEDCIKSVEACIKDGWTEMTKDDMKKYGNFENPCEFFGLRKVKLDNQELLTPYEKTLHFFGLY